ncbi:hypothetical protein [Desulfothermobacter acidiphilus]|uniref:hypothetical protein n=1 Tax=Desulfothermobacter acidiphilus TaxID=1938353 RepID=UPI003F8993CB
MVGGRYGAFGDGAGRVGTPACPGEGSGEGKAPPCNARKSFGGGGIAEAKVRGGSLPLWFGGPGDSPPQSDIDLLVCGRHPEHRKRAIEGEVEDIVSPFPAQVLFEDELSPGFLQEVREGGEAGVMRARDLFFLERKVGEELAQLRRLCESLQEEESVQFQ